MAQLTVNIASPPDRENLVAEIWYGHAQFAELSAEAGILRFEVYPNPSGRAWQFGFDDMLIALEQAKTRLADVTGAVP